MSKNGEIVHRLKICGSVLPWGSPCSCWADAEAGGSCSRGLRCPCHPAPWAGAERRPTALPAAGGASCGYSSEAGTNQTWPLYQGTQIRISNVTKTGVLRLAFLNNNRELQFYLKRCQPRMTKCLPVPLTPCSWW